MQPRVTDQARRDQPRCEKRNNNDFQNISSRLQPVAMRLNPAEWFVMDWRRLNRVTAGPLDAAESSRMRFDSTAAYRNFMPDTSIDSFAIDWDDWVRVQGLRRLIGFGIFDCFV
ncbi:MAG: hypothetical protein HQM00_04065 [Magnetococcales bacterium]|nr:hypothetical protein [Magnetococcales bacterium]